VRQCNCGQGGTMARMGVGAECWLCSISLVPGFDGWARSGVSRDFGA
jgi:hypothetical protein